MDAEMQQRPVTVPLWVLNEAMPALLGANKIYEARMKLGNMSQPFTPADLARYQQAVEIIATEMERAGMVWEDDEKD